MIHEVKQIVETAILNQNSGIKNVLATVVHLDGSSYRQPGVRMLLSDDGSMVGAVSGGCVEKEVLRRAQSVFQNGKSKIITYDGRYRLGCEGVLYILLESFYVSDEFKSFFFQNLELRKQLTVKSYYKKEDECVGAFYSEVTFDNHRRITFSKDDNLDRLLKEDLKTYSQTLSPCFKLLIIGGEHDAVKLCKIGSLLGWEVDVVTSMKDPKQLQDFPGAKTVVSYSPETFLVDGLDSECAVVLMTHNYAQDLRYLLRLKNSKLTYIGVLGSARRREQLYNDLFEYTSDLEDDFLDKIHSPAGLNIGAITPEEIALSILSEILVINRNKEPYSLNTITGKIHVKSE
ncbi:XdhC family protein [Algibacter sp. AS12]|uniref:XdhC family protein n=1 Tax=Algibacter sp. AS12 TaxID=3135773 RepID=UPI00398A9BC7